MSLNQLENQHSSAPLFTIELRLPAHDFQADWKRCSMLANYLAEYTAYQFPRQERAENLISTITNELLEATINLIPDQADLSLCLIQYEEGLQLDSRHPVRDEIVTNYLSFLEKLTKNDNEDLYLDLLTTNTQPAENFNQLGLMMLTQDFGAQLSNCTPENDDHICTRIFISAKEFNI